MGFLSFTSIPYPLFKYIIYIMCTSSINIILYRKKTTQAQGSKKSLLHRETREEPMMSLSFAHSALSSLLLAQISPQIPPLVASALILSILYRL